MIVLTGYEGFIGNKFLEELEKQGKEIIKVEKRNSHHWRTYFTDWNKVELILHQGAISSTVETNLKKIFTYNVEFTEWLFEKAAEHNIPVKYASSASVYGNQLHGTINPLNYYSLSKATIDYWVLDNIDRFPLIQGFRYFNVYGEGEDHKGDQASPIHKFSKQLQETGKLKLFEGSNMFLRDFVYVDDVVDLVLNNGKKSGIYDMGTSRPISFTKVAKYCVDKYGGEIEMIPFPDHLKGKYQTWTAASPIWGDYIFKTVKEYLLE